MIATLSDEKIDDLAIQVLAERDIVFDILPHEMRSALLSLLDGKNEAINGAVLFDDESSMVAYAKGQIRDILTEADFYGFGNRPECEIEIIGSFVMRGELFDQYKSIKATTDELLEFGDVTIEQIDADRLYEFNGNDEILKQNPVMISISILRRAIENVDQVKPILERVKSIAEKSMLGTNAVARVFVNIETPDSSQVDIRAGVIPGILEFVERRYDGQSESKHSMSVYQDLNGQRLMLDKHIAGDGDVFRAFGPYERDNTNPPALEELRHDDNGFVSGAKTWDQAETLLFEWSEDYYGAALSRQLASLEDHFESRTRA